MVTLSSEDEQGICTLEVLSSPGGNNSVRIAIGQEVLSGAVSSVGQMFEQSNSFADESVPLRFGVLDLHHVAQGGSVGTSK